MNILQMKSDYTLDIAPEAMTIEVFSKIFKRDKSKDKDIALKELSYIWFMSDIKSDFFIHSDDIRHEEILKVINLPKAWKADSLIVDAIDFYKSRKSISQVLLEDAYAGIHKLSKYVRNIDLTEEDDNGKLKHDAKKLADIIKTIPDLVDALKTAEQSIIKEEKEAKGFVGSRQKNLFEDGII